MSLGEGMPNIADIPLIPDQKARLDEIIVDCYGRDEELSAFEVYFTDALQPPFAATWRDPDEADHAEPVSVLDVADVDDRRGVLLYIQRQNNKDRRVVAEQLWADDATSVNATVLNDYRYWIAHGGLEY